MGGRQVGEQVGRGKGVPLELRDAFGQVIRGFTPFDGSRTRATGGISTTLRVNCYSVQYLVSIRTIGSAYGDCGWE